MRISRALILLGFTGLMSIAIWLVIFRCRDWRGDGSVMSIGEILTFGPSIGGERVKVRGYFYHNFHSAHSHSGYALFALPLDPAQPFVSTPRIIVDRGEQPVPEKWLGSWLTLVGKFEVNASLFEGDAAKDHSLVGVLHVDRGRTPLGSHLK